jgi:hypothetical protein
LPPGPALEASSLIPGRTPIPPGETPGYTAGKMPATTWGAVPGRAHQPGLPEFKLDQRPRTKARMRVNMPKDHPLETSRRQFMTTASVIGAGLAVLPAGRVWAAAQPGGGSSAAKTPGKMKFALCNEMFENRTMR